MDEGAVFAGLLVMSAVTRDFQYSRNHTVEIPLPTKVLSRNPQSLLQSGNLQGHQILELTPVKHSLPITSRHHSLVCCADQILGKYEPSDIIGIR